MGRLKGAFVIELAPEVTIGRSSSSDLQLGAAKLSREHAVIRWTGSEWRLRDLGSLNGTSLNGLRLRPGEEVSLHHGDILGFGSDNNWEMLSDSAPEAMAIYEEERIKAWMGALVLPDGRQQAVVRRGPNGWVLDREGVQTPVYDRKTLLLSGRLWLLRLPEVLPPTAAEEERSSPPTEVPSDLLLRLTIVEDQVHAVLIHPGGEMNLKNRAPNRALALLAKERLRELARGVASGDAGWVRPEDAADYLGISMNTWYVWLWRIRASLESVLNPDQVLLRRFTGEVRLCAGRIEVREG